MFLKSEYQARELFKMAKSENGGYSRRQLAVFEIPWIGTNGKSPDPWIADLIQNWDKISCKKMGEFFSLKDEHLFTEKNYRKNPRNTHLIRNITPKKFKKITNHNTGLVTTEL